MNRTMRRISKICFWPCKRLRRDHKAELCKKRWHAGNS